MAFGGDVIAMAECYYDMLCEHVEKWKPTFVGHFDLITKYDEVGEPLFRDHVACNRLARHYAAEAAGSGCVFEVNTGAISRGYRTTAYQSEDLLYLLRREDARLILSSDSHRADTLNTHFEECVRHLIDIGFRRVFTLSEDGFVPIPLC